MNYSLEKVTTIEQCEALMLLAGKEKDSLDRRRRNLGESISTFDERTGTYGDEMQSVETYAAAYDALPEDKNKMNINVEIKRLEARKAQLDKIVIGYNTKSLIGKQVDFNLLDSQVPAYDAHIAALLAKRAQLGAA